MKLVRQGLLTNEQKIDDIVKGYVNIYQANLQKNDSEENILVNKLCRVYEDCTKNEPNCSEGSPNHASSLLGVLGNQDIAKVIKRYKDYQKEQASSGQVSYPQNGSTELLSPAAPTKEWTTNDYKQFYDAVELYKDHQFGNKKIAKYMMDKTDQKQVDAAQIRFEKFRY